MTTSTNSAAPLVKEVLLDAPPARVWQALTDKEQLKQWCFDMDDFQPEVGFRFRFYGEKDGVQFLHLCEVTDVIPEQMIRWLWSYQGVPGDTFVTFELMPEDHQTKFRLIHEGLEKLPQDENYARQNFEAGWDHIIGELLPAYLSRVNQ